MIEIKEVADCNKNLHHEMRSNYRLVEVKQQNLINDVKRVKNGLKMPEDGISH